MNFRGFVSRPPRTPYAPTWDFKIGISLCEDMNVTSLSEFLLEKEKEVKKLPIEYYNGDKIFDGYTGLGANSTTSKSNQYNILSWEHSEITKLKQNIIKNVITYNNGCGNETPNELWVQCWYNVLRFGQNIKPHLHGTHPDSYLSGHFNVQVEDTSTVYMSPINQINDPDVIDIKNENSEMTLFPSYIFHYTTPHYSSNPRITLAFDINLYQIKSHFIKLWTF
jgi:hypothetical protein